MADEQRGGRVASTNMNEGEPKGVCTKSFSPVQLFATLWTIASQALLFMGFSRQEYWSGMSCPALQGREPKDYIQHLTKSFCAWNFPWRVPQTQPTKNSPQLKELCVCSYIKQAIATLCENAWSRGRVLGRQGLPTPHTGNSQLWSANCLSYLFSSFIVCFSHVQVFVTPWTIAWFLGP